MKKILLFIAFSIVFRPVLPVFEYITCYNYIVNELCVNKDKPELECNGKCYLMKELSKASESEKNKGETSKKRMYEFHLLFLHKMDDSLSKCYLNTSNSNIFEYSNLYTYLITFFHFHPPSNLSFIK
ncbi:hypothetical protein [Wenyingzhuangia sp. 2_MG-2023]|uniref:hypothetical protein n=1 Tax=Wenyingzhuangia sp. 2_MG-2023 TaxID=3062639 RepID=UPI0026E19DC6|nr:hypothetical protein [Wenyingzhuangia sp. 2_MG-2023]MDO6738606.1 hypothetical protein [Wenyingzhuangia sp. 2_MG-2023]